MPTHQMSPSNDAAALPYLGTQVYLPEVIYPRGLVCLLEGFYVPKTDYPQSYHFDS
ncbi:unnamed protein product, partial [Ceratitis capitata]